MKAIFSGLLFSLFLCFSSKAQTTLPLNSGEVITKATKLHDEGKYKEAIQLYKQIPRNDTNYVLALYETALSQMLDSNYNEALKTCKAGLDQTDDEYELSFMLVKGSVLDDQGFSERALHVYDSALLKYPNSQSLSLNKAICLLRQEKLDEAESLLQALLIQNPYYASAHYKLAQCALLKGKPIQAALSFFAYLLNAPQGIHANAAIQFLSKISNASDDVKKYVDSRASSPSNNFMLLEQIVFSKIALDKNYKVITAFDDPIIRQLQVIMEKLEYNSEDDDFWMQFYVPSFKKLFNNKLFEPSVFYAFSNVNIEKIQQYVKKNKKNINAAIQAYTEDLNRIRNTRELNFSKRQSASILYHYDNGVFFGKGRTDNDKMTGNWEFYHTNGNLKAIGAYTNGKKDGKWTYYYKNGRLSGYEQWKDGEQNGEDLTYNKQGILVTKSNFAAGKLNGEKHNYFGVGHLFSIETYKAGVEEGRYLQYFASGRKKTEALLLNDKLHGLYTTFYENGQAQLTATYDNGKLTGTYKSYYKNGRPDFTGTYVNGELEGEAKSYHPNGKLMRQSFYQKGMLEGEDIEYNDEGTVIAKVPYKNGKAEGLGQYFDDDGKLYSTFLFENDKLKAAKYFDKAGKEISSSIRQNKRIELNNYNPDGFKTSTAVYNDKGQKDNDYLLYYSSGAVKEKSTYINGELNGMLSGYYPNGLKEYEVIYKNGKKHGLYKSYYINGKPKEEGWYSDDKLNGDWINFNIKGEIETRSTYLNNDLTGVREFYFANGKLDYEEVFRTGWMQAILQYDTAGKLISSSKIVNGSGKYKGLFSSGKTQYEGEYVQGELHGPFTNYFYNGSPQIVKNYNHGFLDGEYVEYHYGGKLAAKGKYKLGQKEGAWKYYLADGSLYKEETYNDEGLQGKVPYYFTNGKVEREIEYKNGKKHGTLRRFAEDGQLSYILYFKDNLITGYTFPDKKSQLMPVISLPGGKGKINTFYSNGNKSAEMEYSDGEMIGVYRLYHPNGKVYYESNELYGITNGRISEYYLNGNLKSEYNYYYDSLDGPYKEYYENGKLKEEGFYYNGYPHKHKMLYDINGKLVEKREYYCGILLNSIK